MLIHCHSPAKSGCRFRYTESGNEYWVSCPKRGSLRAWVRGPHKVIVPNQECSERWLPCALAEALVDCARFYAHDDRNPKFAALCRDFVAFKKQNPEFAVV